MKKKKTLLLLLLFISLFGLINPQSLFRTFSAVEVYADTTLAAPKLISAKASSSSSITVKWEAVDGADGYRIYRKTAGTKWKSVKIITNTQTLSYKNTKLSMGVKYTYTVRAYKLVNSKKVFGSYDRKGISARPSIPAPELVSAKALSKSSITLKWNSVNNTDGYNVYRKEPNGKWKLIKTIAGNNIITYTDSGLLTGRKYIYTVRAYKTINSANVLGKYISAGISATTKMTTPKLLSIKASGSQKAILTWKETPGVDGYMIYRKTADSGWSRVKTLAGAENTSYTHKSLVNGITYYYTVRAYNLINGKYIRSGYEKAGLKVTTKTPKITGITAKALSTTSIRIQWPKAQNVDGYRVYRKAINDASWTKMATITNASAISYTDTKAEMGRTYYYTVRGYKKVDGSNLWGYYDTSGISAATAIPVPELVSAKETSHNSILITWKKVDGADGYRIYRKTVNDTSWTRIKTRAGADKVTYTSSGLTPCTTYYYTIIAYKKIDGKNVLSKYNKSGVSATTKESPYSFENDEIILLKGETRNLAISEGTAASWNSSAPATVSVSNGSVTAHKAGKAIITAIVNGEKLTCNITVEDPVLPENFTLKTGETKSLTLEGTSQKVKWSKSEMQEGILELIPSGNNSVLVKALKPGKAYIRAQIADHQAIFTCTASITGYMNTGIKNITIYKGESANINVETNYYINDLTVSSMNASIANAYTQATHDNIYTALVRGNSPGTTIIRISSKSTEPWDYIDIAVTVLEKTTENTGIDQLKDYLKRNGVLKNGIHEMLIHEESGDPSPKVSTIGYEEATGNIYFYYYVKEEGQSKEEEVRMTISSEQTSNIIVQYHCTAESENINFEAETIIDKTTYTGDIVPFRLISSSGITETDIPVLLEKAGKTFDDAFFRWDYYALRNYIRTSMKELGFAVYNSF